MGLKDAWQTVRDVIAPPDWAELDARYAVLRYEAARWAAPQTEVLTFNQWQMSLLSASEEDRQKDLVPNESMRIRSGVPGGTFGALLGGSDEAEEPARYIVTRIDVPVEDAWTMLTEPADAEIVSDADGKVALYRLERDYRDYNLEKFNRLARQIDEEYEADRSDPEQADARASPHP